MKENQNKLQEENTKITLRYEKEIQIIKEASKNDEFQEISNKLNELNTDNA